MIKQENDINNKMFICYWSKFYNQLVINKKKLIKNVTLINLLKFVNFSNVEKYQLNYASCFIKKMIFGYGRIKRAYKGIKQKGD